MLIAIAAQVHVFATELIGNLWVKKFDEFDINLLNIPPIPLTAPGAGQGMATVAISRNLFMVRRL